MEDDDPDDEKSRPNFKPIDRTAGGAAGSGNAEQKKKMNTILNKFFNFEKIIQ